MDLKRKGKKLNTPLWAKVHTAWRSSINKPVAGAGERETNLPDGS